jgi:hypothetical protein
MNWMTNEAKTMNHPNPPSVTGSESPSLHNATKLPTTEVLGFEASVSSEERRPPSSRFVGTAIESETEDKTKLSQVISLTRIISCDGLDTHLDLE